MEITIGQLLLIGFAGMVGTLSRYVISGWLDSKVGQVFPAGTLVVNLTGCLLAGFLFHTLTEKYLVAPVVRTSVLVGFLGGYTTFSAYAVQSLTWLREGNLFMAAVSIVGSNAGGLLLAWLGYSLSRTIK